MQRCQCSAPRSDDAHGRNTYGSTTSGNERLRIRRRFVAPGRAVDARLHAAGQVVEHSDSIASALFKDACEAREAAGCFYLAEQTVGGKGVPADFFEASQLYRRACERRHALACFKLADLYEKGAGVWRDPERAAALTRRSCEYGYTQACTPARST